MNKWAYRQCRFTGKWYAFKQLVTDTGSRRIERVVNLEGEMQ